MRILQIVCALAVALNLLVDSTLLAQQGPFTPLESLPPPQDAVVLVYDPESGGYSLNVGGGNRLAVWEHVSAAGMFIPEGLDETEPPTKIVPPFDILTETKLFKLATANGLSEIDFGPILPKGLSFDDINDDAAQVDGSLRDPCGFIGCDPNSPYLYIVPEPSAAVLILVGTLVPLRRRRSLASQCRRLSGRRCRLRSE